MLRSIQYHDKQHVLNSLSDRRATFQQSYIESQRMCVLVGQNSAQDASSHVPTVTQPVLYEFDVFQVVFNYADQMT